MADFALEALEFGVLGLCAITLILVSRMLLAEQAREGDPRKGILQASYAFMAFSLALALLNGYVQLAEPATSEASAHRIVELESDLRRAEDKLLQIRSTALPLLLARGGLLDRLPTGPERDSLLEFVDALSEVLRETDAD